MREDWLGDGDIVVLPQPADDGGGRLLDRRKFLTELDDGLSFDPVDQAPQELVEEVNGILRIGSGTLQEQISTISRNQQM